MRNYQSVHLPMIRRGFSPLAAAPVSHATVKNCHREAVGQHVGPQGRVDLQTAQQGQRQLPRTGGDGGVVPCGGHGEDVVP